MGLKELKPKKNSGPEDWLESIIPTIGYAKKASKSTGAKRGLNTAAAVASAIPGGQVAGAILGTIGDFAGGNDKEAEVRSAKKKNYIQNYKRG